MAAYAKIGRFTHMRPFLVVYADISRMQPFSQIWMFLVAYAAEF